MKARFTTTLDLKASRNFARKSSTKSAFLGKAFWLFLKGAASCIQLILPNRKRAVEKNPGYQIPYQSKLSQNGQKAFWVNSVGIDQHYHLPGASPPTRKLYGIRAKDFT
jgi:hypothetical protein